MLMRAATVVQVLQDLFYVLLHVLFYLWSLLYVGRRLIYGRRKWPAGSRLKAFIDQRISQPSTKQIGCVRRCRTVWLIMGVGHFGRQEPRRRLKRNGTRQCCGLTLRLWPFHKTGLRPVLVLVLVLVLLFLSCNMWVFFQIVEMWNELNSNANNDN